MKVRCLTNEISPEIHERSLVEWANGTALEITRGKVYIVLAVTKYFDKYFFFIMGDESKEYPLAFPAELFEIVDNKVSKYWDCNFTTLKSLDQLNIGNNDICSFTEWKNQKDQFYEDVLEEEKNALIIFNQYRDKMLAEE